MMQKKILICDDDPDILELTENVLESEGFAVITMHNCNNIVDVIAEKKPDIVLMDLKLPGIGGAEAVKLIKSDKDVYSTPVLLFTANNIGSEIAAEVGADGIVEKPFDIDTLIEIINSKLKSPD